VEVKARCGDNSCDFGEKEFWTCWRRRRCSNRINLYDFGEEIGQDDWMISTEFFSVNMVTGIRIVGSSILSFQEPLKSRKTFTSLIYQADLSYLRPATLTRKNNCNPEMIGFGWCSAGHINWKFEALKSVTTSLDPAWKWSDPGWWERIGNWICAIH